MIVLGVDPGCSGALVMLDERDIIEYLLMPTIKVGAKTRVNAAVIRAFVADGPKIDHAFIELVGAMPKGGVKQGASSMFTFGHAAGLIEGVIIGAGIPVTFVTPTKWKGWCGLIGQDKDAARSRAIQLYPNMRALDQKGKGQALADALLIARYGVQINSGRKEDLL